MAQRILVIDDDDLLRRSLAFNLEQAGYQVYTAAKAEDGLGIIQVNPPDLVLLDIGLPGMDGLEALRKFKDQYGLPVIFLTARRRNLDEVVGLELGADDYITKPFDIDVLIARIKAVMRRAASLPVITPGKTHLTVGDIDIDVDAHSVTVSGKQVELAPKEFDLLYALASEANRVVTIDDLIRRVWGAEYIGQPQVVYVHVRWLREKIEQYPNKPQRILTVRGIGYKFQPQEVA